MIDLYLSWVCLPCPLGMGSLLQHSRGLGSSKSSKADSCAFLHRASWEKMNAWAALLPSVEFLQQTGYL